MIYVRPGDSAKTWSTTRRNPWPVVAALVLTTSGCVSPAQAQKFPEDHGRFDGAEFNASSYRDASLEKHSFRDLESSKAGVAKSQEETVHLGSALKGKHSKKVDSSAGEIVESSAKNAGYGRAFAQSLKPIHELTGDWAPDKIDLSSNGGFSIEPFNGSPVPYELNGHVDPNRGKPWEEH